MVHVDEEDKNISLLGTHSKNGNLSKNKAIFINESELHVLSSFVALELEKDKENGYRQ